MPAYSIDATRCCSCSSAITHYPSSRSCAIGTLCFSCFVKIARRADREELAHFGIRKEALAALHDDDGELRPAEDLQQLGRLIITAPALGQLSNRREELLADHGDRGRDRDRRRS